MSKNVLCVDDSESVRMIVKYTLEKEGFEITEALDGQDGLDKAKSGDSYDLFILDLNMPNLNGIALTKEIRKIGKYNKTPILILTTENVQEKKIEGKNAGANGWVVKPFDPPQFTTLVNKLFEKM